MEDLIGYLDEIQSQLTFDAENGHPWHSSVLLVQADNDGVVPSQQAAELIEGLRSHNIEHDVIVIPNEIHDLARYSSWMMLFNAADAYFDRQLNKRSAPSP